MDGRLVVMYRDEIGTVCVEVDDSGVDFLEGVAFFSDGRTDYEIPVNHVVRIAKEQI